jgi:hypothetical protein
VKPVLELTWSKSSEKGFDWHAEYELVIPVREGDVRSKGGVFRVKLGGTNVETTQKGFPIEDGKVSVPYRDGAHMKWDAEALGLEAWAVYGETRTRIS